MERLGLLPPKLQTVRVYVADSQQMWRAVYRIALQRQPGIELVGSSGSTYCSSLAAAIVAHCPNVLLVGVKVLRAADVKRLKQIAQKHPGLGIVALYGKRFPGTDAEDSVDMRKTCVFMHRGNVDTGEQLAQAIRTVVQQPETSGLQRWEWDYNFGPLRRSLARQLA